MERIMRWKGKPRPEWHSIFPLMHPIELDDGTKILWERVYWRLVVTEEGAGMGADWWKGYTEYKDANDNVLGRRTHQ
jgi:hypothetical protein